MTEASAITPSAINVFALVLTSYLLAGIFPWRVLFDLISTGLRRCVPIHPENGRITLA